MSVKVLTEALFRIGPDYTLVDLNTSNNLSILSTERKNRSPLMNTNKVYGPSLFRSASRWSRSRTFSQIQWCSLLHGSSDQPSSPATTQSLAPPSSRGLTCLQLRTTRRRQWRSVCHSQRRDAAEQSLQPYLEVMGVPSTHLRVPSFSWSLSPIQEEPINLLTNLETWF